MITQLQLRRDALTESRLVELPQPELADGEVLLAIDRFALTANNVSYALSGATIGYWGYFPAPEPWGLVPVWGFADVAASRHADLALGERIYGFFPTASHVVLTPDAVGARGFVDAAPHRADLPAFYNHYQRTTGEPAAMKALEDERCLLLPLLGTGYLLYDYLIDNGFFGAEQVLVGSASSKTAIGLLNMLARHPAPRPQVIGLTSPGNMAFVEGLGLCDQVIAYGAIESLDGTVPTAFVDMAGDGAVIDAIHKRFGPQLKLSCAVGATHWDQPRSAGKVAGAPSHDFIFIPAHIAKRDGDLGPGVIQRRIQVETLRMVEELKGRLALHHVSGPEAVRAALSDLVAGHTPPTVGLIASLA
ncbi:MAG: DUF2855 family protein [Phenylobacterium sp.]|uniref:DUF2855 family protein n=1 Tax=Phenylobacterium sp. TaxID=1871053 RepID=UPI0027213A07|nr:DUF2855 family protein [Phenylobacterium sp.]MDO8902308.1 DUF2855 family protein [Phenylobacterium sp.]